MNYLKKNLKKFLKKQMIIKKKLSKNAKKIDNFLVNFLKKQKKSLLLKPMKYGVISG